MSGASAPTENRWMSPGIELMGYYETPASDHDFMGGPEPEAASRWVMPVTVAATDAW